MLEVVILIAFLDIIAFQYINYKHQLLILHKLKQIYMTDQELQLQLEAMNAKVDKIKTEIQALIDAITASSDVPQSVVDAANTLAANLQTADDLNPDAEPNPEPNPEG